MRKMNLFINSPAYYTQQLGVIDEVYQMCAYLSRNIDVTQYTDDLDTIGIVPMISPAEVLSAEKWREEKHISLSYRMASISLASDYDTFVKGDITVKRSMILDNILRSLQVVKGRLKGKFDYARMEQDILILMSRL